MIHSLDTEVFEAFPQCLSCRLENVAISAGRAMNQADSWEGHP